MINTSALKLKQQLAETTQTYWVLARDAWKTFRKKILFSLGFDATALALEVAALGLAFTFAKSLQSGQEVNKFGLHLNPRDSIGFLIATSAAVFLTLASSAVFRYLADSGYIKLSRLFEEKCTRRIVDILCQRTALVLPATKQNLKADQLVRRIQIADAKMCGRVLKLAITGIFPLIRTIVFSAYVFYTDFRLTMLLVVPGVIYVFSLYRINLSAFRLTNKMEEQQPSAYTDLNQVNAFIGQNLKSFDSPERWSQKALSPQFIQYLDSYEKLFLTREKGIAANNLFLASVIFIVIIGLGMVLINEQKNWGHLIAYLIAIRYAVTNMKALTNKITSCNRFFPTINRYYQFLKDNNGNVSSSPIIVQKTRQAVDERSPMQNWSFASRENVLLLADQPINKFNVFHIAKAILPIKSAEQMPEFWAVNLLTRIPHGITLKDFAPPNVHSQDLQDFLKSENLYDLICDLDWGAPLTQEDWQKLSPKAKIAIQLAPALFKKFPILFIDWKSISALTKDELLRLLNRAAADVCFITATTPPPTERLRESVPVETTMIVSEQKLQWIGPLEKLQTLIESDSKNLFIAQEEDDFASEEELI